MDRVTRFDSSTNYNQNGIIIVCREEEGGRGRVVKLVKRLRMMVRGTLVVS